MSSPASVSIRYSTRPPVFFGGKTVEGIVDLHLERPVDVRSLRVLCVGKTHVHWTQRGSVEKMKMTYFWNGRTLFDMKSQLLGSEGEGGGRGRGRGVANVAPLSAGTHSFAFVFPLPQDLPVSYEGQPVGYIRYWCQALLEATDPTAVNSSAGRSLETASSSLISAETKHNFTVTGFSDLNQMPDITTPIFAERDPSYLGCGLITGGRGRISAMIKAHRRGFVPGETMRVSGSIRNGSPSTPIRWWKLELVQAVKFVALEAKEKQRAKKQIVRVLCSIVKGDDGRSATAGGSASQNRGSILALNRYSSATSLSNHPNSGISALPSSHAAPPPPPPAIPAGGEIQIDETIQIPPTPPTELKFCDCIFIAYKLRLVLAPEKAGRKDMRLELPVIIGTVPLKDEWHRMSFRGRSRRRTTAPTMASTNNNAAAAAAAAVTAVPETNPTSLKNARSQDPRRMQPAYRERDPSPPPAYDELPTYADSMNQAQHVGAQLPGGQSRNGMAPQKIDATIHNNNATAFNGAHRNNHQIPRNDASFQNNQPMRRGAQNGNVPSSQPPHPSNGANYAAQIHDRLNAARMDPPGPPPRPPSQSNQYAKSVNHYENQYAGADGGFPPENEYADPYGSHYDTPGAGGYRAPPSRVAASAPSSNVYYEIPEVDAPYAEMPLPTYNESHVDVVGEGGDQQDAYRPYYPTYEWDC